MKIAVIALSLILMLGCGAKVVIPPQIQDPAAAQFLQDMLTRELKRRDAIESFRGLYRVVQIGENDRALFRYAFLMQRPDTVRLDVLPSTGAYALGLFVSRGGHALALDPANKRALRSDNSSRVIRTVLGLPLSADELASVALGTFPVSLAKESFEVKKTSGAIVASAQDGKLTWFFDPEGKQIQSVEVKRSAKGALRAKVTYQRYRKVEGPIRIDGPFGTDIPEVVTIEIPDQDVRLDLTLTSAGLSPEISEEKFVIDVPADYTLWQGTRTESD